MTASAARCGSTRSGPGSAGSWKTWKNTWTRASWCSRRDPTCPLPRCFPPAGPRAFLCLGGAAEVGSPLARAGVHLVCGGLGGCMAGASRGYKEANGAGICLGILPGTSKKEANPWVDLAIPTGVNSAQGALVAMAVDAAIVLGGGGGTLSEVGLLLRDGKPVVALDGTGGAAELVGGRLLGKVSVRLASSAEDAVRMVLEALRDRHPEKALDVEV